MCKTENIKDYKIPQILINNGTVFNDRIIHDLFLLNFYFKNTNNTKKYDI